MPDEQTTTDDTKGRTPSEDKAAVTALETKYKEDLNNLKSAKDQQSNEYKKSLDALNTEKANADAALAKQQEEATNLKAEMLTRVAEDKADLTETISELSEDAQAAVNALPDLMSDRDKLRYIKANKALFLGTKSAAKVFSQPTGGAAASATTSYTPSTTEQLARGGPAAIKAEREAIRKDYGG